MESRSSNSNSGGFSFSFSWADEVEREEREEREEELQKHQQQIRINPFGAARPREVVLEEKGVDWKNLDHHFNFDSSTTTTTTTTTRECKTSRTTRKKPLVLDIQKSRNTLPLPLPRQQEEAEEIVPPLKYLPKNINLVFEEIHRARNLKHQSDRSSVSMGSNAKHAAANTGNRPSYTNQPRNAQPNLNSVLVNCNKRKEKAGSNFEADSIKENVESRRVLAELNDSSCNKVPKPKHKPSSNSYFGVLELLEPTSSLEKSNLKKSICHGSARKTSKESEENFGAKLEAGRKKREKPPTTSKSTRGKKSKK